MRLSFGTIVVTALAIALTAPEARAQDIDAELLLKWGGAQTVHYDVVAEYAGEMTILRGSNRWGGEALVKDRFEVSFDWSPVQTKLVGKPVFKNFPSTVPPDIFARSCAQPPITGNYDHVEITDVKPSVLGLELAVKRTYPAGQIPYLNEVGKCGLIASPAKTETLTHEIIPPSGTFFATPHLAPKNVTVGKDGKTIVVVDKDKGWKYTYTLRIIE